ncbi:MAG: adenosylcobinamide-GDP ribazoletransferase [Lachnospiraceae bacterium]|nr:adenosylcobinamide-GDP ribazoletransferase [Lachnospiraceae bacterium]
MNKYFRAFMMSLSMFTALPCPFGEWDEDARPLMTLFLPLVGAVIGALWALAAWILRLIQFPSLVDGIILCAFPIVLTGGIHMDGFMDTVDAVKSWRSPEERRRILKDPHVGSFAVIAACLLIIAEVALFASAKDTSDIFTLIFIPVVSRTVAALGVTILRPISASEYSGAYRKGVKKEHAMILLAILAVSVILGFILLGRYGFASLAVIAGYLIFLRRGFCSLDGMSGDISGYALTIGELCGIAVFALV